MPELADVATLIPWKLLLAVFLGALLGWFRRDATQPQQPSSSTPPDEKALRRAKWERDRIREELQSERKELTVAERRIVLLESRLEWADAEQADVRPADWDALKAKEQVLEDELAACNEHLDFCARDLADAQARILKLVRKLDEAAARQLAAAEKVKALERNLERRKSAVLEGRRHLDAQALLVTTLQQDLQASHQAVIESEGRLAAQSSRIEELEAELASAADQRAGELEERWQRLREMVSTPGGKDDLKKIRGIGKAAERKLNELGVVTYLEIALWDDDDVERISEQLGGPLRARLTGDDWVAGARAQLAARLASQNE